MSAELASATAAALGEYLADVEVSSLDVVEGGLPELVRRGRRVRLGALIEGPLFEVVRETVSSAGAPIEVDLPGELMLRAALLTDGRVALRVTRAAPSDVSFDALTQEGLLPVGVDAELVQAVNGGSGVVFVGSASVARVRCAIAVARAATKAMRVASLSSHTPVQCMARVAGADDVVTAAQAAVGLGADVLYGHELSAQELALLVRAALPVPVVASCAVSSVALLRHALRDDGETAIAALGVVGVCGFDDVHVPRLLELHGDTAVAASSPPVATASPAPLLTSAHDATSGTSATVSVPVSVPANVQRSRGGLIEEPIILSDAPPAEWASEHIDDDPGWELGPLSSPPSPSSSTSSSAGSFDKALEAVAKRPSYQPKAPPMHPQAAALRGTGGLTFEPPGGASEDDE